MPQYERIRLFKQDDLGHLFPLLRIYALDPSIAETVKDIHIAVSNWIGRGCFRFRLQVQEEEKEVDVELHDGAHKALKSRVRQLGLQTRRKR
jgi:hypothetical protein